MLFLIRQRSLLQLKSLINPSGTQVQHTHNAAPETHYDIIIGGGGLIGTTLAAALSKQRPLAEKKILLLEASSGFKGFDAAGPYSNRVSAINQNSMELFKSIGSWEHMTKARVKHVKQMQIWESNSDALIQFQHDHFAEDIACIIENPLIIDAAYAVINQADNVSVKNRSRIACVQLPGNTGEPNTKVLLKDGTTYSCDLLVGADGPNSVVRKQMDINVLAHNYDSLSLVANLNLCEEADNSVAWQRFLPTGPLAMLPLNDKMSSIVWSTSVQHARQLLAMSPEDFVNAVNEAFCKQYARVELADRAVQALNSFCGRLNHSSQYPPRVATLQEKTRATFPLGIIHAASYVRSGVALIGDAAHRIHPLAGQGVNLGFSDVHYLVETLADGAYAGAKLGDKQYLMKYERKCLAKNVPLMIGVHGLYTLYTTEFSPMVILRSLGLQLTQNLPAVKQIFMKQAMG